MQLLGREQILQAADLPRETVDVPEWGGAVIVQGLNGAQRISFENMVQAGSAGQAKTDVYGHLAAMTIVDEAGRSMFSQDDVRELSRKSARALHRVFETAVRLSGMTREEVDALSENFIEAPNGASPSASPSRSESGTSTDSY